MTADVRLREVVQGDVAVFFEQQRDQVANSMVAFPASDPNDEATFRAKWARILADETIAKKTVLCDGQVAGNVLSFVAAWSGQREVGYWIGREFRGRGVATRALEVFLLVSKERPLHARVARRNVASIRVLEKCGFTVCRSERCEAGGEEVEEVVLRLAATPGTMTLDRIAELSGADREELRRLSLAVYPPEEVAGWPGRHLEWSEPEWCVRVRDERGDLVSSLGVQVREAELDGRPVLIGGIGGVKTYPAARGRGFARAGIGRAIEFFHERPEVAFALLVCEPGLRAYYARLGWREFGGRLLVRQRGATCEFTFNGAMTHGVQSEGPTSGTIDLCGPPW